MLETNFSRTGPCLVLISLLKSKAYYRGPWPCPSYPFSSPQASRRQTWQRPACLAAPAFLPVARHVWDTLLCPGELPTLFPAVPTQLSPRLCQQPGRQAGVLSPPAMGETQTEDLPPPCLLPPLIIPSCLSESGDHSFLPGDQVVCCKPSGSRSVTVGVFMDTCGCSNRCL